MVVMGGHKAIEGGGCVTKREQSFGMRGTISKSMRLD